MSRKDIKKNGFPLCDYHIHADYADAKMKIEEIIPKAKERGLVQIAITEHIWKDAGWIDEYIKRIEFFNTEGPYVLIGAEARIINNEGDINIRPSVLDKFDLIIGVLHRYNSIIQNATIDTLPVAEAVKAEERALINMIRKKNVHVVGHIGRALELFAPHVPFPEASLYNIIVEAKKADIAVEINARSNNALNVFTHCVRLDCPMTFGSDSHELDTIGQFEKGDFLRRLSEIF